MSDNLVIPSVGRIVHFTPNVNDDFNFKQAASRTPYPAIVVGSVAGTLMLTLNVFTDQHESPSVVKTNVSYTASEYLEVGQEYWNWPERD